MTTKIFWLKMAFFIMIGAFFSSLVTLSLITLWFKLTTQTLWVGVALGLSSVVFLFLVVYLYLRFFVQASLFLLDVFNNYYKINHPDYKKSKNKTLFDLAHSKNPYLISIRPALNAILTTPPQHQPINKKPLREGQKSLSQSQSLSFSDIIHKVQQISQQRFAERPLKVDLKADLPVPGFFADMLCQAIWELVKNAHLASPPKKEITINTWTKNQKWFCCEVKDRGPGMDRSTMQKATQLYWSNKPHSTGLGLPFVQSSLSRIGGIMKLNSPTEGGLTVVLFIPKDYLFHPLYGEQNHGEPPANGGGESYSLEKLEKENFEKEDIKNAKKV